MTATRTWLFLGLANICLATGLAIFAKAFFPYKPFLAGLAQYDDLVNNPAPAQFDKLIFMLVDALRSDFVFSNESSFYFTQSLISSGNAIPLTAHATAPTVTMPRVKALTTGSIPGFLDMILNIAESDTSSTLTTQDNWLAQMKHNGKKLNLFGDDTWLKLFPGIFSRSDGTTSFFVSDFTEVDNNVTRHVDDELVAQDWDVTILHYLGLDHIGHKGGPRSSYMRPKQAEMDDIVKRVYTAMETQDHLKSTLFVLCGDHGMNDVGNHGGSSAGETSAALVFMSPKFKELHSRLPSPITPKDEFIYYDMIEQSDVAPTLASLFRFPIPKNSLGLMIEPFLKLWEEKDQVKVVLENAQQLVKLLIASHPDFPQRVANKDCTSPQNQIDKLACAWRHIGEQGILNLGDSKTTVPLLLEFTKNTQRHLASAATNYDVNSMIIGIVAIATALLPLLALNITTLNPFIFGKETFLFWSMTLSYGGMMIASSYVEEEQLFWYWATSAWCIVLCIDEFQAGEKGLRSMIVLILLRIARRWNQTGQKHAGADDIAKNFLSRNPGLLWCLILVAYATQYWQLRKYAFRQLPRQFSIIQASILPITGVAFKLCMANLDTPELIPSWLKFVLHYLSKFSVTDQGKIVFINIAMILIYTIVMEWRQNIKRRDDSNLKIVHTLLTILMMTQSRLVNIPLFLIFHCTTSSLPPPNSIVSTTTTVLLFQHFSFYALGNSNAISSIDLSNAYNGVNTYDVNIVGLLTFISNWAGPIYWTSAGTLLRQRVRAPGAGKQSFTQHVTVLTWFRVVVMVLMASACMALRTHLFIWTVFSPKFLFALVWCGLQHVVVDGGLGAVLDGVKM